MPEFSESYIALMRGKPRLYREYRNGDWYLYWLYQGAQPRLWADTEFDPWGSGPQDTNEQTCSGTTLWLPLEGDWLEMLDKAGSPFVNVERLVSRPGKYRATGQFKDPNYPTPILRKAGGSRLEALALLYFAIKPPQ